MLCSYQHKSTLGIVLFQFPKFPCILLHQPTTMLEAILHLQTWVVSINMTTESFVLHLQALSWFEHTSPIQLSSLPADAFRAKYIHC